MAKGPGKENDKDFHETEYYSKFHEQETDLSKTGKESSDPSGEIDEETIQDLMDATLSKGKRPGGQAPVDDPTGFDTDVKADWLEPSPSPGAEPPTEAKVSPVETEPLSPQKTIRRTHQKGVVGRRKLPRRRKQWWQSRRRVLSIVKGVIAIGLLVGLGGLLWYTQFTKENVLAELEKSAAKLHEAGDFQGAIEKYEEIRQLVEAKEGYPLVRLRFLTAAAHEGAWNKNLASNESFQQAMDLYERTIEADESEMRVYAVESLMAKSGMWVRKANAQDPTDPEAIERAKNLLEEIIADSNYRLNPTVNEGIPYRKLADLIREEDPLRAIDLLTEARKNQGDLERGYENLEIGLIYKDLLDDPDQAVEFFERVSQNELAPREIKAFADTQLDELKASHLENPSLYPDAIFEFVPEEGMAR